jgi:hypothetical protein
MIRRPVTVLLFLFVLVACGASARTKALQATHVTLNVARDTLLEVSRTREGQLVDACNPPECTLEQGKKQLGDWRAKVDQVAKKLEAAYRLLAAAALASDAGSSSEAIKAAKLAAEAVGGLR